MRRNKQQPIFAHKNKYERNIFRRFGKWFVDLKTWKKVVFVGSLLCLIVLILILSMLSYAYSRIDMIPKVKITTNEKKLSCVDVDGYVNILLLGVDSRNMDNIEGAGADMIIILSLKEETGEIKLLSVYRDTYLKMGDKNRYGKITSVNRSYGPEMMIQALNQAMDLDIKQFVVVNFKTVADLVNQVGGIIVDIEDYEIHELNKYTKETAKILGQKEYKLVEDSGTQVLEGVQAVAYGRIRKGVGDDFKRTERMRIVVSKVFDKIKKMTLREANKLLNKFLPQVRTNMKNSDLLIMASKFPAYRIVGSESWPYEKTTGLLNSVSFVFPYDLAKNTAELHERMFGQEGYVPSDKVYEMSRVISEAEYASQQPAPADQPSEQPSEVTVPEPSQSPVEEPGNMPGEQPGGNNEEPPAPWFPKPWPPTPDPPAPEPPTPDPPAPEPPTPDPPVPPTPPDFPTLPDFPRPPDFPAPGE